MSIILPKANGYVYGYETKFTIFHFTENGLKIMKISTFDENIIADFYLSRTALWWSQSASVIQKLLLTFFSNIEKFICRYI